MFQYVALVSGTTVLDLTALPYALVSYGMQVAPLNDNELGLLYADVEEPMTIHVTGFTAADAYANINAVNTLLDQARRWRLGEPVEAVLLRVQAQDSSTPLDVALLGRPPGGENPTTLPPTWNASIGRYIFQDVALSFVRHGQWLNPTTETGSSTAAANPTVQSIAISSSITRSSPIKLACQFRLAGVADQGYLEKGVILTASAANRMQIYEAEAGTLGTNVASVADVANEARGGAVARYSPGVLASQIGIIISPAFDPNARRLAFWAAIRNNSATTTWTIRVRASNQIPAITPVYAVDASTTSPRIAFLGIVTIPEDIISGVTGLTSFLVSLTASAASGTLDIDYFVVQAVDDETSAALLLIDQYLPGGTVIGGNAAGTPTTVDHQLLSKPTAKVISQLGVVGATVGVGYAGNPMLYSRGSMVATVLGTSLTDWRISNGGNVNDTQWTATRSPAFLVPE